MSERPEAGACKVFVAQDIRLLHHVTEISQDQAPVGAVVL